MRKLTGIVFILAIVLTASNSFSLVLGGSNLGFTGYDEPDCYEPIPPYDNNKYAWDLFQSEMDIYRYCIEEYLENAENDIKRIQKKMTEAVDDFNSFVNSVR